jgi:hypothetical protein
MEVSDMARRQLFRWRTAAAAAIVVFSMTTLLGGVVSVASGETHYVILNTNLDGASWSVDGTVSFTIAQGGGCISTDAGTITLNSGDRVKIVLEGASSGKLWMGSNGWVNINNLPVKSLYVNGNLVASSTEINANINYDVGSVESSLKITVTVDGSWAELTVDGSDVVNYWNYTGYIIVYDAVPTNSKSLLLNIGTHYFRGVAAGAEWNGNVIGVPEYPFLGFFKQS